SPITVLTDSMSAANMTT
ncbi:pectate disaccharide-lyase, partial [Vibrio parahaemolyticus AQ3810]